MVKHNTTTLAALLATSVAAFAGSTPLEISGNVGANVATAYINKGRQLDCGPSVQPYFNANIPTGLDGVSLCLGAKQNFQSNSPNFVWYRNELDAGITLKIGRLSLLPYYESVGSPDKRFAHSQGVNLVASLDDKGLFPFALNPYIKGYLNTSNTTPDTTGGHYYEAGIKPTVSVFKTTVGFPVSVGVGDNKFYPSNSTDGKLTNNLKYGYTSVGISTDTPLSKNISLVTETTGLNTSDVNGNKNPNLWLTSAGFNVKF